jgi:hypothetical protein
MLYLIHTSGCAADMRNRFLEASMSRAATLLKDKENELHTVSTLSWPRPSVHFTRVCS